MNTDSPVSDDIHICGRCRSEFHDIYQFIDHKKHCGINNRQSDLRSQGRSTIIDHNVCNSQTGQGSHLDQSKFPFQNPSEEKLPHTKTTEQPFLNDERNIYQYPSEPKASVALNLCYDGVSQPDVNAYGQYQTAVDSSGVIKNDGSRLEYGGYEANAVGHHGSTHKLSNLDNSSTLPVVAATSQELFNSSGSMVGIPVVSDNTVDSTALCPEDLEVGQISEAMMGKLGHKYHPKGPGLANRKLNESSSKRVGRLDPISTFTLRRKCGKSSANVSKSSARSLPLTTDRINSSSAPLTADCEEESPVDHLDLKGVTFEKRERLQGVSDDLLSQSPSTSMAVQNGNGRALTQFQNVVGSSSDNHKAYSTENPSKSHGVYKAVFTSPSSGGHRLSVKLPNEGSESEQFSHGHNSKRENVNRNILQETNCSTSYKNISKLTEVSKVEKERAVPTIEYQKDESMVSNSNFSHMMDTEAVAVECVETTRYEETVKEYPGTVNQLTHPAVKMSEQIYSNDSISIHMDSGGGIITDTSGNSNGTDISRTHDSGGGVVLEATTSNTRTSLMAADCHSWEPEEIQVIASTDQMNYVQLSSVGDDSKEIEVSLRSDNYTVDGEDTMVLVYKRDDGNLIMMCKPNTCDGGENGVDSGWQAVIESVVNDSAVTQAYQHVHSVVQHAQGEPSLEHQDKHCDKAHKKGKESSPRLKEKSLRKIAIKPSCTTDAILNPSVKCDVRDVKKSVKGSGANKIFTCHFGTCSYSTKLDKDFQRHYRTHTGERPFKCDRCDKTFNRSDKLKNHLRSHEGQKPFQCKICKYATTENSSLKKHMRIHTDERPFQCQICPYASRNSSQLIVHLRTHTGDAPFHCSFCSAQFKINSDLKRHLRTHTGEKPFACDKCDYRSSNKGNLKTHHKINHSLENEKSCPQCSFATSSLKRLREHIKLHDEARVVKCSVCQYTCNSSTALRSHMMVHNTLRPYRCSVCPYSSKQSGNLKKHVQNVHHEKHRPAGWRESKASVKYPSLSTDKSHGHSSVGISRRRTRAKEENTGPNHKVSANPKPDLPQRPARRHSSSRKIHVCPECGCGFVRHDSLRCHLKQHGEKDKSSKGDGRQTSAGDFISPSKSSDFTTTNNEQTIFVSTTKTILSPPPPPSLPQPPQLPPAPPQNPSQHPPPPPTTYRNKGLESIVAAASKLYRDEYMNGKDDDDDDQGVRGGQLVSATTLSGQTYQANVSVGDESFRISDVDFTHEPPSSHSTCVRVSQGSHSTPLTDVSTQHLKSNTHVVHKRHGSIVYSELDEEGRQPSSKKQRTRRNSSASKDLKHYRNLQGHMRNATDVNGQVPWEHSSYTASASKSTTCHSQQTTNQLSSSSSSSSSSSTLIRPQSSSQSKPSSSLSSSLPLSLPSSLQSSLSSSLSGYVPVHNQHTPEDVSPSQPLLPLSQNSLYQYSGDLPANGMEVSVPSQPISIQLLPQPAPIHHSQTQNVVSNVPFPQHRATTALQILLPAGTQIIQPPPPPLPSQLPPPPSAETMATIQPQQQQPLMGQPQIVFQVQETPTMTGHRQDVVTIPVSMATQQFMLGQCPTYGVGQKQVITSPADSTTAMGVGVYSLDSTNPLTDFHPSSGQ